MRLAITSLTKGGHRLAEKIHAQLDGSTLCPVKQGIFKTIDSLWCEYDGIICIMATGIVVRSLAPLCKDKRLDPCVLVLDEKGRFVISLLSGHLGGGNELAVKVAAITKGKAVITTASDVTGHTALDLWAQKNGLLPGNNKRLTMITTRLINRGCLKLYSDIAKGNLPDDMVWCGDKDEADVLIAQGHKDNTDEEKLLLRPMKLFVGLGCNRNTGSSSFEQAVSELCAEHGLDRKTISRLASIDIKKDEAGLLTFAEKCALPLSFYSKDQLNGVEGISSSKAVLAATGAKGVAEPAAILAASTAECGGQLIIRKIKWKDVTAAVAARKIILKA